jgi:hypothetical protein
MLLRALHLLSILSCFLYCVSLAARAIWGQDESSDTGTLMTTEKVSFTSSDIPQLWPIASKLGDWLHTLLQLYFVINIAVIGWILTTRPYLETSQKVTLAAIYVLIISVNLWWMLYLHSWLKNITGEIEAVAMNVNFLSREQNIPALIGNVSKGWRWYTLLAVHLISDSFVVYCILCLTSNQKLPQ